MKRKTNVATGSAPSTRASEKGASELRTVVVATDFSTTSENAIRRVALLPLAKDASVHLVHALPEKLPTALETRVANGAKRAIEEMRTELEGFLQEAHGSKIQLRTTLARSEAHACVLELAREHSAELIVVGRHGKGSAKNRWVGTTAERIIRQGSTSVLVVNNRPKKAYERPLVAVDLGKTTADTLQAAQRIVCPLKNDTPVVYCQPVPYEPFVRAIMTRDEMKAYQQDLQREAKAEILAVLEPLTKGAFKPVVKIGDPRTVVLKELEARKSDLLIVGTRARSGAAHLLVGSVAEALVRQSTCDVLIARPTRA